jgi:hypothetical protein
MARTSWNPIAFVPTQVTIISSIVYIALFAVLLWIHTVVPSAPSNPTPVTGINLTAAWLDLERITDGFHPFDSRRNEVVREYLISRIEEILKKNGAEYKVVGSREIEAEKKKKKREKETGPKDVTVFEDNVSNVTFVDDFRKQPWTVYTESTNVMVYIRGEDDEEGDWWDSGKNYDG